MNENKRDPKIHTADKCPFCGGKIERGYLISPRGWVYWNSKPHKFLEGDEPIGYTILTNSNFAGFICRKCNFITFDYEWRE